MYFYIQPYIIYNSFILICCSCVICVHFFSDSTQQRECIVHITQSLLQRFKLEANENTVVYHHWYDLNTGKFVAGAKVRRDSGYVDENGVMRNVTITRPLQSRSDFFSSRIVNVFPDTAAWVRDFQYTYNDPKMKMYFSHGAFAQYPVVGVTWEQAQAFCNWRTKLYYGTNMVRGEEFRLPTEAEWEYAARGGRDLALYPWGGNYVRDSKGCYLANFKPARAGFGNDSGTTTMKVGSFAPNNYGLYDMAGNVSEWTSSAYNPSSNAVLSEVNPNFQYNAKNDDPPVLKRKVVKGGSTYF